MTKEGLIKLARHRVERKSQERHFSDESVLNMKRGYEIKCEQYESEIKKLKNKNDELIAKIDKMKCCENCKHSKDVCEMGHYFDCKSNKEFDNENNADYWELKE